MRRTHLKLKLPEISPFAFVLVLVGLYACSYIAPYSQYAYQQATSLKGESLALMSKATEPYSSHEKDIKELETKVEKAYEYSRGRPKNELTAKQWQILKDPEGNLLGGFIRRWEEKTTLSKVFIDEAKGLVSDAFDTISGLESGKIKKGDVQ